MQDETEKLTNKLKAIGDAAPVDLTHYLAEETQAEIELESLRTTVEVTMAGEAARTMLVGASTHLQNVADTILAPGNNDWLADAPNRIEAGESDVVREDHVYQTPDWERATGRRDNAIGDLIG